MDIVHAILLGIVQGLGEPLPISSSGHLILIPWIVGWPEHSLTFDVALHGGTALAIIIYFWSDWLALAGGFLAGLRDRDFNRDHHRRLAAYIAAASIPGAVAGFLLESTVENALRVPWLVATLLMAMGLVMLVADRTSRRTRSLRDIKLRDALLIGVAQALALVPGVSRSGVTITMGLFLQMSRPDAARFSFLLSGPIVAGAFLYKMLGLAREGLPADDRLPFAAGIAAATVVGFLAIRFLLTYLQRGSLALFVVYRFLFGALVLILFALRGS